MASRAAVLDVGTIRDHDSPACHAVEAPCNRSVRLGEAPGLQKRQAGRTVTAGRGARLAEQSRPQTAAHR